MIADPDEREIITPAAGLARRAEHGGPQLAEGDAPERVLLAWGRPLLESAVKYARAEDSGTRVADAPLFVGKWGGVRVGIVNPGIGAPATALAAEKLAAAGARVFAGVGFAGSISPLVKRGTLFVASAAERDEGVSAHYAPPAPAEDAHPLVAAALEFAVGEEPHASRVGKAWTTDAPYRETVAKARAMRRRGADVVEMETAALFAVARFRGFRAGSLLVVTDELARFAADEVDMELGEPAVEYAWTPAPPGSVERESGAALRAALAAVTGRLVVEDEAAAADPHFGHGH